MQEEKTNIQDVIAVIWKILGEMELGTLTSPKEFTKRGSLFHY